MAEEKVTMAERMQEILEKWVVVMKELIYVQVLATFRQGENSF